MRRKEDGWEFWLRTDLSPAERRLKACGVGGVNLLCDPPEQIDAYHRQVLAAAEGKGGSAEAALPDLTDEIESIEEVAQ